MDRDDILKNGASGDEFPDLDGLTFSPESDEELPEPEMTVPTVPSDAGEDLGQEGWEEDPWLRQILSEEPGKEPPQEENREPEQTPEKPPRKKWSRKKKALVFGISGAVLAVILLVAAGIFYWNSMLNRIRRPEMTENSLSEEEIQYWATYNPDAENQTAAQETTLAMPSLEGDYITNILVIGQDYRKGEATKLADSIILCSLNRKNATLTLTSFLRDTYIQMPNFKGHTCGKNRINVVYNLGWQWAGELGGMEMMDLCLKNNFGIEVDHNVEINFETFSQIINKLGGVDVELNEAEVRYLKKDRTGFNNYVRPGMNHLDGYTALCYARARKLDGDVQRTARQRKVVSAIVEKVRDMNLKELTDLAWDILPLVLTDMSNQEITALIRDVLPLLPKLKIQAGMCPAEGTYWGQMIDIAGMPSSVIGIYLEPNRKLLQWICEVPAFEASPDSPPEYETLPPPTKKKEEEETKAPTTKPAESTEASSDPTGAPSTDPTNAPPSDPTTGPTGEPEAPPTTNPGTPPTTNPETPPTTNPATPPTTKPATPPTTKPETPPTTKPATPPTQAPEPPAADPT